MCLAARPALVAAPAPPPLTTDPLVTAARAAQRRRMRMSAGYNTAPLPMDAGASARPSATPKTLLGQ